MNKKIILILYLSLILIFSCAVRLVPVEDLITKEANGIIIKVGKQNRTFYRDDIYTPIYIKIINNTDKKIKFNYSDFMMVDDKNNQFSSVPFEKIFNRYEKNKKENDIYNCPPYCNPFQIPYYGGFNQVYGGLSNTGALNPYYSPFYPYISSDPYLYYKDKDGNFKALPPAYTYFSYPPYPIQDSYEDDPSLMALRMEEIFPHFQIQGYIYFHQAARLAENKVKLLVSVPGHTGTENTLEFEFVIK